MDGWIRRKDAGYPVMGRWRMERALGGLMSSVVGRSVGRSLRWRQGRIQYSKRPRISLITVTGGEESDGKRMEPWALVARITLLN
jgi:hypothetical protein